ncbi:oxysterol-binding protein-related protein 8 isoform X2 [Glossina fuscipes]|uniref:Oxysterol-binding protein n=1 Tax=Glossina fuscipes TaxID=7396 RepID=A0A9C6DTG9_9MUSC|nr:oxysterol-binding protein-related protein 8 isoform X2 [Glossina fuscipes]
MKFFLGLANWANDTRDKYDGGNQTDKTPTDTSKLNRKESYKAQRKNYRREKKRVASELLNSLQDPAVIVLADWLKVRGTLKSWTKLWCVLKPGLLLLYKSPKTKSSHWVGTILLTSCQVIERPSKKDGFCFKLFHPLEQSIWAPRGPDKETIGAVVQPLPTSYLIFRAPSQAAGKCWMDALELSLRCSGLLLRSNSAQGTTQSVTGTEGSISHETQWSEADYEKHFKDQGRVLRKNQYLMVPDVELSKSQTSSTSSLFSSASQTPILQQLYMAMTNWEQIVSANVNELDRFRRLQRLRKSKSELSSKDFEYSDLSSVEGSPRRALPGMTPLTRATSMSNVLVNNNSSSSSDEDECITVTPNIIPTITVRPVSAPPDLDGDSQNEAPTGVMSGIDTDTESDANDGPNADKQSQHQLENEDDPIETPYVPSVEEEINPETGEQVEELAEENKSLIWCLLKQVRPGMDLSKVTLPTFILEPRSFLDKLSDSYYHADILSCAVTEDDPFTRMKLILKWYLSGFYKKPKGLKKPYNPILGETFRCYWEHQNSSRTYFIAEQVSHHPPVSAFYVTNRQEGFSISCSILAKSKFYGNSTSAVLDGEAKLTLLPRGECYVLNTPYAHCKGILMGTLSMELGGKISIECESTGYKTELEFKLKPFLGGADHTNCVVGKIKLVKEVLATIEGHWDGEMRIKDVKTGEEGILFAATKDVMKQRLQRYIVPFDSQLPNESERLWSLVSAAIRRDDQRGATEEKTVLEEAQRKGAKERKATFVQWDPYHFSQDLLTGKWIYKYADLRPWDPRNDVKQYEIDYKVLTKTRHLAPMVRTASIVSVPAQVLRGKDSLGAPVITKHHITSIARDTLDMHSDSSQSQEDYPYDGTGSNISNKAIRQLMATLEKVNKGLDEHTRQLTLIHLKLERMQYAPHSIMSSDRLTADSKSSFQSLLTQHLPPAIIFRSLVYLFGGIILSLFLRWLLYP